MEVNKHNDFDQIFREKLHDMEVAPPAQIWENIQATQSGGAASSSLYKRWWAAAGILAVLLGGAAYLYFSSDQNNLDQAHNTNIHQGTEINQQTEFNTNVSSSEKPVVTEDGEKEMIADIEQSTPVEERVQQVQKTSLNKVLQKTEEEAETKAATQQNVVLVFDGEMIDAKTAIISLKDISDQPTEVEVKRANKAGYDFFDEEVTEEIMNGHNEFKHWELGIEFSPEWITIPDNNNNIKAYGLDFSARYHFSKWFIESGIGASISKDDGIYRVDTISKFKGSYQDVYEVTFDTSGAEPIPIYHTELKNVYENIDTNYVSRTKNNYVYLNIPLNIGYSSMLGKKFAIYFKTGIINSFKIYEDIPAFETIEGESSDLIHSEAAYFNRTNWNMQAQLNVGINYYITDKFIFGVEPNARYFIKSLVEDNNGGNPYGFGVKIGFKYVIKK